LPRQEVSVDRTRVVVSVELSKEGDPTHRHLLQSDLEAESEIGEISRMERTVAKASLV
jgi:hypothetical protein